MATVDVAQMPNGEFQVHRAGCADLSKGKYARANIIRCEGVATLRDIVLDIYPPDDFGYEPDQWEGYSGDMRVVDCATRLLAQTRVRPVTFKADAPSQYAGQTRWLAATVAASGRASVWCRHYHETEEQAVVCAGVVP